MPAQILDGKKLSKKILNALKTQVQELGFSPRLTVVAVGDDPATAVYVKQKQKRAAEVGIALEMKQLPSQTSTEELIKHITSYLPKTDGLIVQLPLPNHIDNDHVLASIPPDKDVDCLSPVCREKLEKGEGEYYLPPTANGILALMDTYGIKPKEKNVVIVGAGHLVGQPLSYLLKRMGAKVTVCDIDTKDLPEKTRDADVIISGVGKPGLITGGMVKEGVVIVDAGTSKTEAGLVGDVSYEDVAQKASYITPVPGGVGPMTVATLLKNTLIAAKKRALDNESS